VPPPSSRRSAPLIRQSGLPLERAAHPLLELGGFETVLPEPLGELVVSQQLTDLLQLDAPQAELSRDEQVRLDVRDLLRHGGYKPTGRGKPASEYLIKAAAALKLQSINLAVDACNAISLHSGLPISVVDLDRAEPPLSVKIVEQDLSYEFNRAGQQIQLRGLVCLHDAVGPCANAVKDSQRTKTSESTRHTLSLVWGCRAHPERLEAAVRWYRQLLEAAGASTQMALIRESP